MNTHNNTQVKTAVGTFQVKYHRVRGQVGYGRVGSYGIVIKKVIKDVS